MVIMFQEVEIIEHPIIHDCTYNALTGRPGQFCKRGGPLVQLSWDASSRTTIAIDEFEYSRKDNRHYGRNLRLPKDERIRILHEKGYELEDIDLVLFLENHVGQASKEETKKATSNSKDEKRKSKSKKKQSNKDSKSKKKGKKSKKESSSETDSSSKTSSDEEAKNCRSTVWRRESFNHLAIPPSITKKKSKKNTKKENNDAKGLSTPTTPSKKKSKKVTPEKQPSTTWLRESISHLDLPPVPLLSPKKKSKSSTSLTASKKKPKRTKKEGDDLKSPCPREKSTVWRRESFSHLELPQLSSKKKSKKTKKDDSCSSLPPLSPKPSKKKSHDSCSSLPLLSPKSSKKKSKKVKKIEKGEKARKKSKKVDIEISTDRIKPIQTAWRRESFVHIDLPSDLVLSSSGKGKTKNADDDSICGKETGTQSVDSNDAGTLHSWDDTSSCEEFVPVQDGSEGISVSNYIVGF